MASVRWPAKLAIGLAAAILLLIGLAAAAGFFDRDAETVFGRPDGGPRPLAAVLFSGDMGLRFGMGPHIVRALAKHDVPVLGISSPSAFGAHRSQAQVEAIVAGAIRDAIVKTGARQVVMIGQSFGADMVRVGLSALAPELRDRVAAVVLVVPGRDAWFRADPSGIAYHAAPDAGPGSPRALAWAPLVCIKGAAERDSLCPLLDGPDLRAITLPGGHFLRNDHALLVGTILGALRPTLVEAGAPV
jgi:type IV secretory pathway VirJ component